MANLAYLSGPDYTIRRQTCTKSPASGPMIKSANINTGEFHLTRHDPVTMNAKLQCATPRSAGPRLPSVLMHVIPSMHPMTPKALRDFGIQDPMPSDDPS